MTLAIAMVGIDSAWRSLAFMYVSAAGCAPPLGVVIRCLSVRSCVEVRGEPVARGGGVGGTPPACIGMTLACCAGDY